MRRSILLAEDNEDDVFFFRATAKRINFAPEILVAPDGREAIELLKPSAGGPSALDRLALVLLDLKMPFVGGLEVLEWIRSQPHLRLLPVVMLTSSEQDSDIEAAYRLGAASYLVKPSQPEGLSELLRAIDAYWIRHNRLPAARVERQPARTQPASL